MEDVIDKIQAGINAFDTLIAFKKKFPKYSKDFVKLGVKFMENNNEEQVQSATLEETVTEVKKKSESVDQSQVDNDSDMDKVDIASSEIKHRTPVPALYPI